jgi:hypothetical protein
MESHPLTPQRTTGWASWIVFAALFMVINGVLGVIQGLVSLFRDDFFIVTDDHIATFNVSAWGWIHIVIGAILIAVGLAVFKGALWARVGAVVIVSLNLIAQFTWASVFPVWAVIVIAIDALVLWALIVHGDEITL